MLDITGSVLIIPHSFALTLLCTHYPSVVIFPCLVNICFKDIYSLLVFVQIQPSFSLPSYKREISYPLQLRTPRANLLLWSQEFEAAVLECISFLKRYRFQLKRIMLRLGSVVQSLITAMRLWLLSFSFKGHTNLLEYHQKLFWVMNKNCT